MAKVDWAVAQKYQKMLEKDPNSQVFAPLAEAYREMGNLEEAERVARAGVKRHPQFPGGLVTLGKILRDQGLLEEALFFLKKVNELAPENILSHSLSAEIYLQLEDPKEALRCYKMILLFNPQHAKAKTAIQKLESLTADEYDEELFEMTRLRAMANTKKESSSEAKGEISHKESHGAPSKSSTEESGLYRLTQNAVFSATMLATPEAQRQKAVERLLSLVDAFIIRNDLERAKEILLDGIGEFGPSPELQKRLDILDSQTFTLEEAPSLEPLLSRDQSRQEKKKSYLEQLLFRLEMYRQNQGLP